MSRVFLGIDLGTSNVKICMINDQKEIIRQVDRAANANIITPQNPKWHEQNPKKIVKLVMELFGEFADLFAIYRLECIGVSGQMHGVVLWQKSSLLDSIEELVCSNLITWMDNKGRVPMHLLPRIVDPGYVVGHTKFKCPNVPEKVKVLVAMGDTQVIHIGTSSQILFLTKEELHPVDHPALMRWPFFFGEQLIVAASLNGGNVFQIFVEVSSWSKALFIKTPDHWELKRGLFDQIFSGLGTQSSTLIVKPLLLGERHQPEIEASIEGWTTNTSGEHLLMGMADGIISNLAEMMPERLLSQCNISTIKLINKASHHAFVEAAKKNYPNSQMLTEERCDLSAAYGAALFCALNNKNIN